MRYIFSFILMAAFCAAEVVAQSGSSVIDRIDIRGSQRVDRETVMLQISTKVGQQLDRAQLSADIKEVYKTGFFDQVSAKLENKRDKDGRSIDILVFDVKEKPAIRQVTFEGNDDLSDSKLKEKFAFGGRAFANRSKIKVGVLELQNFYQSEGFFGTTIDFKLEPAEGNQVDLVLNIKEGEKKHIIAIDFEGNKEIEDADLEEAVSVRTYSWWRSWITGRGTYRKEQLDADSKSLAHHYLTKGYIDVQVGEPEVKETEDGLTAIFKVQEGEVYHLSKISIAGDLIDNSTKKTAEGLASKVGDVFNVDDIRADTFLISEKFSDIGYAFANVEPLTSVDKDKRSVDLKFQVEKGQLVSIRRINVSGNDKTRDNVIRRSLKMQERETYSSSKIKRSKQLLERLGYFDEVSLTPQKTEKDDQVDLLVSVAEGSTGQFNAGAGVSSGEGFIFSTSIKENNVMGTGRSVGLDLNTGSKSQRYILSVEDPRFNDSNVSLGADLSSYTQKFDKFDNAQTGGSLTAGYPLWFLGEEIFEDTRASLTYQYLFVDINNIEDDAPQQIKDEEGTSTSSSITPKLMRNTVNNPLDPTKGSRQSLSTELAGLGGSEEFWLAQFANTYYYPVWEPSFGTFVFAQRTRLGYGDTYNNEPLPLFRRFFPGGINSIRGYDSRQMGPKDENGEVYGGSKQLVGNFEMIFPLIESVGIKGLVFYDIGEAFDDEESIDFGGLRRAVGWGIRWRSPIAPIRIEIGYPLDREDGDSAVVTNFSFGNPL